MLNKEREKNCTRKCRKLLQKHGYEIKKKDNLQKFCERMFNFKLLSKSLNKIYLSKENCSSELY